MCLSQKRKKMISLNFHTQTILCIALTPIIWYQNELLCKFWCHIFLLRKYLNAAERGEKERWRLSCWMYFLSSKFPQFHRVLIELGRIWKYYWNLIIWGAFIWNLKAEGIFLLKNIFKEISNVNGKFCTKKKGTRKWKVFY